MPELRDDLIARAGHRLSPFLLAAGGNDAQSLRGRHDLLAEALRNLHSKRLDFFAMDRPLIALGLVLLSVPLLFSVTRGLLEAVLIAPVIGALAYYVLLRDWE
jgi:hypothetical protein